MSLDFVARMQQGRDLAVLLRNNGGGGGGCLMTRTARQATFDASYHDDELRAAYLAQSAVQIASDQAELDALNAAEIARFGYDLAGNRWEREEVAPSLPARGRVALARRGPARAAREHRQREVHSMRGREFKKALEAVGLSQYAAAPFLGLSLRQVQRIAAGEYEAPEAVAKLLQLMIKSKLQADEVG